MLPKNDDTKESVNIISKEEFVNTNTNEEQQDERAKKFDLSPLRLKFPIQHGVETIDEVIVRPPTGHSLMKYKVKSISSEYLTTPEGQLALAYACLPKLADELKEQISHPDIAAILDRYGDFMA